MKDTNEQMITLFERFEQTYLEEMERQQAQAESFAYYLNMGLWYH